MNSSEPVIACLTGRPACGKSFTKDELARMGFVAIETSDEIKKKMRIDPAFHTMCDEFLANGVFLPDHEVFQILQPILEDLIRSRKDIVLSGFPRTADQAKFLVNLAVHNEYNYFVFVIEVDKKTSHVRNEHRRKKNDELKKNAEHPEESEETLKVRNDDSIQVHNDRIAYFDSHYPEMKLFLSKAPGGLVRIDGHQLPDKVFNDIFRVIEKK